MSSIQLTVANNTINISINIAELLNKGSINISLNNQLNPEIPVAELVDNTNVTIRKKTRKINEHVKKMLIIEDDEEEVDNTNVTIRKKTRKIKEHVKKMLIIEDDEEEEVELEKELEVEEPIMLCQEVVKEVKRKYISHKYKADNNGLLMCPYCDCKKKNLSTLSMHVSVNHASEMGKEVNPHRCEYDGCNASFPIKTRLHHHIKNHHEIETLCCPFPNCKYIDSKNKATLYTHYVRKHMNYDKMCKNNTCNTCGLTKNTGIIYHLATCNANSPFCKQNNN
jgi:hypothetical protein